MKKTRDTLIKIILPLMLCSFLTGFAYYKVNLKIDENDPLVDLSTIIKWGGLSAMTDYVSPVESDSDTTEETDTAEDAQEQEQKKAEVIINPPDPKPELKDVTISVVGETIKINGTSHDIETIDEYIEFWNNHGMKMHFDYEYADYKAILKVEDQLKNIDENYYTEVWPE